MVITSAGFSTSWWRGEARSGGRRGAVRPEARHAQRRGTGQRGGRRRRRTWPAMDELAGKTTGKTKTKGKQSNGDVFKNIRPLRWRERRELPLGGGGRRRNATVSPEKLTEEFAGNLAFPNFSVRSAAIGVAARETGCTFGISVSRTTSAYIYTQGSKILEIRDILGNNWFSELK